jgi:PBP1b-binding outer membrane lipoprotein LpoB
MKSTAAALLFAIALTGCSYVSAEDSEAKSTVKENAARTKRIGELTEKQAYAQSDLTDYLTSEIKKCEIKWKAKGKFDPAKQQMLLQPDNNAEWTCFAKDIAPAPGAKAVGPGPGPALPPVPPGSPVPPAPSPVAPPSVPKK